MPLRTPREAFANFGPHSSLQGLHATCVPSSNASHAKSYRFSDVDIDSETNSDESFESALSSQERRTHQSVISSCSGYDTMDESASSDGEKPEHQSQRSNYSDSNETLHLEPENEDSCLETSPVSEMQSSKGNQRINYSKNPNINHLRMVPKAFWPYWVYRMYDSYCLAQRAAGRWNFFSSYYVRFSQV